MPSTASEWLASNPNQVAELREVLIANGVSVDFLTEYPDWMLENIAQQLTDTFSQSYWDDIEKSYGNDVNELLRAGIRNGKSMGDIAQEMTDLSDEYAESRAMNIARTESGHALNGARKASMDEIVNDPQLVGTLRPTWQSALGTTTRDSHAILDGVPADKEGMWTLSGYKIPWPAHYSLPPGERCNCQCTIVIEYGLQDLEARDMIEQYNQRVEEYNKDVRLREKFNPYHDSLGRFSTGSGSGAHMAPDTGGGTGGGSSDGGKMQEVTYDKDSKKWLLGNGKELPDNVPRIPPAWTGVRVNTSKNADLVVVGVDAKGRKQSIYSEAHWTKAAEVKFARVNELRSKVKNIEKEIKGDLKVPERKEQAACLRLVLETGIRPGSDSDTGAAKKAYGATTLEGRHVKVVNGEVRLQFVGKKGVDIDIPVTNKALVADLLKRKKKSGDSGKLFNTSNRKLLQYTHTKDGGSFKTKDFRTAKATTMAIKLVSSMSKPKNPKEYKKSVKEVATVVSQSLGNTPTIALQSYIHSAVFTKWRASAGV